MWRVIVFAIAAWLVFAPALFVPYAAAIALRERLADRSPETAKGHARP